MYTRMSRDIKSVIILSEEYSGDSSVLYYARCIVVSLRMLCDHLNVYIVIVPSYFKTDWAKPGASDDIAWLGY